MRVTKLAGAIVAGAALTATAVSDAATMTFTATRDTTIVSTPFAGDNFNGSQFLGVGAVGGSDQRSVLSFDVSGLGVEPVFVQSVTLRLIAQASDNANGVTFTPEVHAINSNNADWVESQASYSNKSTGTAWTDGIGKPGTGFSSTVLSSLTMTSTTNGQIVDFVFSGTPAELNALINGWRAMDLASTPNPGLVLLDPNAPYPSSSGLNRLKFNSREDVTEGNRPQLIVTYLLPEPSMGLVAAMAVVPMLARRRGRA